ncbi:hypothetical protein COO60DRAFT_1457012 [Scenedesmus sp. NREL 46B-D3]|nr:hypothetical protein COO60DRAFT_1457012 [Scenedesmus sp. NREL 46B-D3]
MAAAQDVWAGPGRAPFPSPGAAMQALNMRGMNKKDARLRSVKRCCDQVVMQVFQGHATVQLQGSTAKSTSLKGRSDWDFFVRLNDNLPTVTQAQRKAVHDQLQAQFASAGIHYRMQCGENRIRLFQGRDVQGPLPNCDVVFQRYKSDVRLPPNSKALASSHTAQQVVRYFKLLPRRYTNLPQPKSSRLEQAVMLLDNHMRCQRGLRKHDMEGPAGYDRLLNATMQAVAGIGDLQAVRGVPDSLQQAGMNGEWRLGRYRCLL